MPPKALPPVPKELQAGLDGLNASKPASLRAPYYLPALPHQCDGKWEPSALELEERYVTSWTPKFKPREKEKGAVYAIIYREGTCPDCGVLARSTVGTIVRVFDRPPCD